MTAREAAVAALLIALGIVMAMVAPVYFAPGNLRDLLLSNLPGADRRDRLDARHPDRRD